MFSLIKSLVSIETRVLPDFNSLYDVCVVFFDFFSEKVKMLVMNLENNNINFEIPVFNNTLNDFRATTETEVYNICMNTKKTKYHTYLLFTNIGLVVNMSHFGLRLVSLFTLICIQKVVCCTIILTLLLTLSILKIISCMNKTTCSSDPFPTRLLMSYIHASVPILQHIVNLCLTTGDFPISCKSSIVIPLIKKLGLG